MKQSDAIGTLAVVGVIGVIVAVLFVTMPGPNTAAVRATDEPLPGQRFQVTLTQEAESMSLRVLTDLETGRDYLIVDWGEGTGVTPLLPASAPDRSAAGADAAGGL